MKRVVGGKKKLIISYENLSEELKELFKEEYSNGYSEYLQKIVKPNGDPIFVVPLETEDTSFMVKFEVVIDTKVSDEDLSKDIDDLSKEDDDEITVEIEDIEEGKGVAHKEFDLKHGDYDETKEEDEEEEDEEDDEEDDEEEEDGE